MADSGVTPTPTTNQTATDVNTVIDQSVKAVESAAITSAEAALDAAVPFFAAPVISTITDALISWVIDDLGGNISAALQKIGTFTVIDIQTGIEKSNLSDDIKAIMADEKSGDAVALAAAIKKYAQDQSAAVNSDGSASPQS